MAARAGVSKSLVSLVLQQSPSVSDKRREAVLKAAAELGYRANGLARRLVSGRTHTSGVVVTALLNPFYAEVLHGINAEARAAAHRLLVVSGADLSEAVDAAEGLLAQRESEQTHVQSSAPLLRDELAGGDGSFERAPPVESLRLVITAPRRHFRAGRGDSNPESVKCAVSDCSSGTKRDDVGHAGAVGEPAQRCVKIIRVRDDISARAGRQREEPLLAMAQITDLRITSRSFETSNVDGVDDAIGALKKA